MKLLEHIHRYLSKSLDLALTFSEVGIPDDVVGYSNSYFA